MIFLLLKSAIDLLPVFNNYGEAPQGLFTMLSISLQFFPSDVLIFALGSIIFWTSINLLFGAFKFIIHLGGH